MLKDTADFAESVELMMKKTLGVSLEEHVCWDTFVCYSLQFIAGNSIIIVWQYGIFHCNRISGWKAFRIPVTYNNEGRKLSDVLVPRQAVTCSPALLNVSSHFKWIENCPGFSKQIVATVANFLRACRIKAKWKARSECQVLIYSLCVCVYLQCGSWGFKLL
jgi:hypothetical protein